MRSRKRQPGRNLSGMEISFSLRKPALLCLLMLRATRAATSCWKFTTQTRSYALKEANIAGVKSDGTTLKWYNNVSVDYLDGDYVILLDDRVVKTPKKNSLAVPSEPLAWTLAAEWEVQGEKVRPSTMPMMTLATTGIDVIPEKRSVVIPNLLNYLKTDVCCTRIPRTSHPDLRALQDKIHGSFCKWFSQKFNVPLLSGSAFGDFQQAQETLDTIQWHLFELDDFELSW